MEALRTSSHAADPAGAGERVHDNVYWRGAAPRISVCIPAYRADVSALMDALAACRSSGLIEVIIHDDGGRDHALLARMEARAGHVQAAIRIVSAEQNRGRAAARNAAIRHARADWLLLLDADMMPDDDAFIDRYLDAIDDAAAPKLIVGGYSLKTAPSDRAFALHRWQAQTSECQSAAARNLSAGRFVFSSNLLVHRAVLDVESFDESFTGWGWEDTDWGLRVQRRFPILHIDNTATHLGLDPDDTLMRKYAQSGSNFALMAHRNSAEAAGMPLFRMATRFRRLPMRKTLAAFASACARSSFLPLAIRGRALKVWRALIYAEAL